MSSSYTGLTLYGPPDHAERSTSVPAETALEFGRFRVLLRQRQVLADGIPLQLGTRGFDLLLVLLEAGGALVTKDQLLSRVWPGITVSEQNLKVQISALRKALGDSREFIGTDVGRGYRFTGEVRPTAIWNGRRRCDGRNHRNIEWRSHTAVFDHHPAISGSQSPVGRRPDHASPERRRILWGNR
jgi:DNA-binding winged helix-turn-helix (wHTH) protein